MLPYIPPAIRQLKSRWTRLSYLEQADATNDLVKRGFSRRALARELGCSEGLLRHIQKAASLPASVKESILAKRISFRAAVMPAKELSKPTPKSISALRRVEPPSSTLPTSIKVPQPPTDAKGWAKLIVEFAIKKYSNDAADCRQLIKEARDVAHALPDPRHLNIRPLPAEKGPEFIIEHSQPHSEFEPFSRVSRWLAGWLLMLLPDKKVRNDALNLALDQLR